jgi:hypothetical protein
MSFMLCDNDSKVEVYHFADSLSKEMRACRIQSSALDPENDDLAVTGSGAGPAKNL